MNNKRNSRRDVTRNDTTLTFVVKCDSIDDKHALFDAIDALNVDTFVYRSQYDANRAQYARARDNVMKLYAIASMKNDVMTMNKTREMLTRIDNHDDALTIDALIAFVDDTRKRTTK